MCKNGQGDGRGFVGWKQMLHLVLGPYKRKDFVFVFVVVVLQLQRWRVQEVPGSKDESCLH